MLFCTRCFASETDSSGGGSIFEDYCTNCGSGGMIVSMEEAHIRSIRSQASWIGKRYYPDEEDKAISAELKLARWRLPIPIDREAKEFEPGFWWVGQSKEDGNISVMIQASSKEEAIRKSRTLLPAFSGSIYTVED